MKKSKKYKLIIIFVVLYAIITITILIIHKKNQQNKENIISKTNEEDNSTKKYKITKSEIPKTQEKVGDYYYQKGKRSEAIENYKKELKDKPNNAEIHLKLGLLYMDNKKNVKRAKYHLRRVLEINPSYPKGKIIKIWLKKLEK
jgi:tetratricopeptide (TPR) repeat protein